MASFAGIRERWAERAEPILTGTDPPRWSGGEAARVSGVLAVAVQHAENLLFLYVFADQLGVPIPAAPGPDGGRRAGRGRAPAVGLGVLGTLVADLIWYFIGRLGGSRVLGVLCRVAVQP
jgi:hypothetical protein